MLTNKQIVKRLTGGKSEVYTQKDIDKPKSNLSTKIFNWIYDYVKKNYAGGEFTEEDIKKLAIDFTKKKYTKKDVLKGLNVELEHKDLTQGDLRQTYKIAKAHLDENPRYYDYLEVLENPRNYSVLMALRGEGIWDITKSFYNALKKGRKGERHAILWKDGEFKKASYMGPGTHIVDRLREGVEPITKSDKVAQAHDIRYSLSKNQAGIADADKKMVDKLKKIQKSGEDSLFNTQLGMRPIQAKMFLEKYGIVKPGKIAEIGGVDPKDEPFLREKLKQLELEGYGYGGCNACGGNLNLIMQKNKESLTEQVKDALELISDDTSKGDIFGSYVYRSQYYPSDIDYHEIIDTTPANEKDIYKKTVKIIQSIVRDIQKRKNIYFGEFKAGIDKRFDIDVLDIYNFMDKLDNLLMNGLISKDEYVYMNNLFKLYRDDQDINAFDELTEMLRMKKVIRWDAKELLRGYKILVGNKKISLEDAMKGLTPVKIDIWAPINGRYIEITNFFFLVTYSKDTRQIKLLNSEVKDYVKEILKQVEKYSSELFFNPFKMAKRMWGIARELKYDTLLTLLTPLFQGSIAKINQIIAEIETIILMYERIRNTPDDILNKQIDEFKARLSYIYDIEYDDNLIYGMIDEILSTNDKKERIEILDKLKSYLKDIVNIHTVEYLKDKSLYPVPSFIYNLVSPDYDKEGVMNIPLFEKVFG